MVQKSSKSDTYWYLKHINIQDDRMALNDKPILLMPWYISICIRFCWYLYHSKALEMRFKMILKSSKSDTYWYLPRHQKYWLVIRCHPHSMPCGGILNQYQYVSNFNHFFIISKRISSDFEWCKNAYLYWWWCQSIWSSFDGVRATWYWCSWSCQKDSRAFISMMTLRMNLYDIWIGNRK